LTNSQLFKRVLREFIATQASGEPLFSCKMSEIVLLVGFPLAAANNPLFPLFFHCFVAAAALQGNFLQDLSYERKCNDDVKHLEIRPAVI
jgi:hypothetical protein